MSDEDTTQQTQNEEVEEPTPSDSSPEEPTEEPSEETPEEPAEEPDSQEEDEPEGEPEADTQEEPKRKGKGAEKRIRSLVDERNKLRDQLASQYGGQQPQTGTPTPAQAAQGLQQIDQYVQQTGTLPEEITVEDYNHLQAIRDGRVQAQTDSKTAELERTVYELKLKDQVNERYSQIKGEVEEAIESHSVLNRNSADYDQEIDDIVSDSLDEALKQNPNLNVKKYLASQVKIYERARAKGGDTAAQGLAKQAAGSALTPRGSAASKAKDPKDMSKDELYEYIAKNEGVHN